MSNTLRSAARGAAAGAIATIPMSAVMLASERLGAMGQLPPETITRKALAAANREKTSPTVKAVATAAHFAFGAAAGAAYGAMQSGDDDLPLALTKGVGFGLAVYALSYAGWMPALDILPPPQRDREDRQITLVISHVVYGAALALLARD